ncbi:MAG: addiction module protein [Gemmataceae bacterium]|nr:addiction module protein [Gemmataceae bacterium]
MAEVIDSVMGQVKQLPPSDRLDLALSIVNSVLSTDDVDHEWQAELRRRIERLRSGTVQGIPLDEMLAELEERYP